MSKIIDIKEIETVMLEELGIDPNKLTCAPSIEDPSDFYLGGNNRVMGYHIVTDDKQVYILIDAEQDCCEQTGYLSTLDKVEDFIGADLLDVRVTDEALKTTEGLMEVELGVTELSYSDIAMFVNVETSKGTIQFTLYNDHNGYYSHQASVIVDRTVTAFDNL